MVTILSVIAIYIIYFSYTEAHLEPKKASKTELWNKNKNSERLKKCIADSRLGFDYVSDIQT